MTTITELEKQLQDIQAQIDALEDCQKAAERFSHYDRKKISLHNWRCMNYMAKQYLKKDPRDRAIEIMRTLVKYIQHRDSMWIDDPEVIRTLAAVDEILNQQKEGK